MEVNKVEIPSVPSGTINALRFSGYENVSAIEDLIDNSIDAGADEIRIDISNKQIFIADNGSGMSYDDLINALKLGGKKMHDDIKDLGKFGFGLITASISIAPRFTIITKKGNDVFTAVYDTDKIINDNEFYAIVRRSTEMEKYNFGYRTKNAKSGTVLILSDCDKIRYDDSDKFTKALIKSVKRVFRVFIREQGLKIFINNEKPLQFDDPLFLYDPRTELRLDKTVDIKLDDDSVEQLRIVAVTLPPVEKNEKNPYQISPANQGFYSLRNNREIAAAQVIPEVFKRHGDYNLLRIELHFSSRLDEEMNVNFSKHDVSPSDRIINVLKSELDRLVLTVREEAKKRQKQNQQKKQEKKNPFLKTDDNDGSAGAITQGGDNGVSTDDPTIEKPADEENVFNGVKISFRFKNKEDALFETTISKEGASVLYNASNVFYQDSIMDCESGAIVKKTIDSMIDALICSAIKNSVPVDTIQKLCDVASGICNKGE